MKQSLLVFLIFFNIQLIKAQKNVDFISRLHYPQGISDVWGYSDSTGKEYVLLGTRTGPSIVDISNPANPIEVAYFGKTFTFWWDLKEYNGYVYVTNEAKGGLFIINLNTLGTGTPDTASWSGSDSVLFTSAHNIFIDEDGIGYIFGANYSNGGAIMVDLKTDPMNPKLLGIYDMAYVHDGYVRNDTLWAAEIYQGHFSVVDVANKSNPVVLATQETPFKFAHNTWLSDDGNILFTTDEKANAYIAAFDVSDLSDIKMLDAYRSTENSGVIPHNTFFKNNFLVNSYYRDGVTIVDATRPQNLVETGYYDTSPLPSGVGFEGAWGVYPYFNSGLIAVSDQTEGLFILEPKYTRAAYLEGNITDNNNDPLPNAEIEIIGYKYKSTTDLTGNYKTGAADSGAYDIRVSHPDCISEIVSGVVLQNGQVTHLNIELQCMPSSVAHIEKGQIEFLSLSNHAFKFYYNLQNFDTPVEFTLSDINGRVIKTLDINDQKGLISISINQPSGIYFASIFNGNFRKTIKIAKTSN